MDRRALGASNLYTWSTEPPTDEYLFSLDGWRWIYRPAAAGEPVAFEDGGRTIHVQ